MGYLLSTPLILTVLGMSLVAVEATRSRRNPLLSITGLVLVGLGLAVRLLGDGAFAMNGAHTLLDVGAGLLAVSALMLARKGAFGVFLILGLGALGTGATLSYVFAPSQSGAQLDDDSMELLVELGPDDSIDEIASLLAEFGASVEQAFPTITMDMDGDLAQVFIVRLPDGHDRSAWNTLRDLLRADAENVDHVESNRSVSLAPPPAAEFRGPVSRGVRVANDPLADSQWALDAARIDGAHRLLSRAEPVRKAVVAILDTGVDATHEDITNAFLRSPASNDAHGHGTHCAGIAGASTNNGVGMASLNWEGRFVDVTSYRALGSSGIGTIESIAQAIIDATTDGADVISMSLGDYAPTPPRVIRDAVEFALERDVIVVAAAGNSNQDAGHHMPANIEGVIAVAAVDPSLRKASFSNTNASLQRPIAAPGVDILSLVPDGGYETKSGTSMATPLVAGLIGALRALDPSLTAERTFEILHETGQELSDSRRIGRLVDAEKAVTAVVGPAAGV